jgi:hypothetical protein
MISEKRLSKIKKEALEQHKGNPLYKVDISYKDLLKMIKAITHARNACAEAYQIMGVTLTCDGDVCWEVGDTKRALDNISAAANGKKCPHKDLLPWPMDREDACGSPPPGFVRVHNRGDK